MSNAPAPSRSPHRLGRTLRQLALGLVRRMYAVGVIVLTGWLSFLALRYLVVTLMFPSATPPQITGIPTRLSEAVLGTRRDAWPGVEANVNPRSPLAHYHRMESWIQPDKFNNCTQSGCHAPLPHSQRKELRAFLNMHATSLHCGVCHLRSDDRPLVTTWYDLRTGRPRAAPAVLQTYAWIASDPGRRELASPTSADQDKLVQLLRDAARETDYEPALTQLAEHVADVRYSSPGFQALLERARAILPRHFRGEYGAKLALLNQQRRQPILATPGTAAAVEAFQREAATADPARRQELLAAVHPACRSQPLHCTECHRADGSLIDFAALGYPPARQEALVRPVIFQMIENIAAGHPMYLPQFLGTSQPAATAPTGEPSTP
jgi:hypothetical protein